MMNRLQFLTLVFTPLVARCIPAQASPRLPSRIQIADRSEPGQRLILSGRALGSDGRPLAGVEIYAYHTGADGLYRRDRYTPEWPSKPPRLEGTLRTAADGSYEIDTIKPAAYPSRNNPAHIHFKLRASGFPEQGETIWFEGDPLLTAQQKAPYIVRLRRDNDGVLRGTHNFRLGSPQWNG
jgi:protocatechuate 3,4-dioxygenase beta subunit